MVYKHSLSQLIKMGSFNKELNGLTISQLKKLNDSYIQLNKIQRDNRLADENITKILKELKDNENRNIKKTFKIQ